MILRNEYDVDRLADILRISLMQGSISFDWKFIDENIKLNNPKIKSSFLHGEKDIIALKLLFKEIFEDPKKNLPPHVTKSIVFEWEPIFDQVITTWEELEIQEVTCFQALGDHPGGYREDCCD